jgi:DNA mismatch repair protein MutL
MKGKYPMVVLFIEIPFDAVDVNVHPTKREVRFFNHQQVYEAVSRAVDHALSDARKEVSGGQVAEGEKPSRLQGFYPEGPVFERDPPGVEQRVRAWGYPETEIFEKEPDRRASFVSEPIQASVFHPDSPRILGQVMGTYILAESGEGLLLIDQHAAHERIVYEALKKKLNASAPTGQALLVPETLELNHRESDILLGLIPHLSSLGIDVEPFGGTTFIIKSVPSIISQKAMAPILAEIIETSLMDKNEFSKDRWLDECLILMACHKAVRANLRMNAMEMENLLKDLEKCDNPLHCPHGRPIRVTLSKNDLEKLFKRIV